MGVVIREGVEGRRGEEPSDPPEAPQADQRPRICKTQAGSDGGGEGRGRLAYSGHEVITQVSNGWNSCCSR